MWIKFPLHNLKEVACKLNLSAPFWSSHYYPKMIPLLSVLGPLIWGFLIQSMRLVVMLSLGARAIILRRYPFSLCLVLSSGVRSFNLRDWSLCSFWELMLLSLDDTRLVYAWHSYRGLLIQSARLIVMLSLRACTIILRWYPFSLRLALLSGVRSFNLRDWLSCSPQSLLCQISNF